MRTIWVIVAAAALTVPAIGQTTETRLFRVSASSDVGELDIAANGIVSWSNHPSGGSVRVEAVYNPDGSNDWETYTEVNSDGGTGTTRVFDRRTPPGLSLIPAGRFMMGSPESEPGRVHWENQHQVSLTRDFYMQRTEVTNQQMVDVMNWALTNGLVGIHGIGGLYNLGSNQQPEEGLLDLGRAHDQILWDGPRLVTVPGTENYPCYEVSWYGAQAYCSYLSDMEGRNRAVNLSDWSVDHDSDGYRLPTEAEWEFACRAGTTTALYSGALTQLGYSPADPNLDRVAWFVGNAPNPANPVSDLLYWIHPVGLKEPNNWGLHDMLGNVWEYCEDWWDSDLTDLIPPDTGADRVIRGGAYDEHARFCRSAARKFSGISGSKTNWGFRPVSTVMP